MTPISFTHMFTGKTFTVLNRKAIAAIIHGTAKTPSHPNGVECTFILLEGVKDPVPLQESEEFILTKLGLKQEETKNE